MNRWTLLTVPEWADTCPSMPGKYGPTYAKQIEVVDAWIAPAMRSFYEARKWRQCPHQIFAMYKQALDFDIQVFGVLDLSKY